MPNRGGVSEEKTPTIRNRAIKAAISSINMMTSVLILPYKWCVLLWSDDNECAWTYQSNNYLLLLPGFLTTTFTLTYLLSAYVLDWTDLFVHFYSNWKLCCSYISELEKNSIPQTITSLHPYFWKLQFMIHIYEK